MKFIDASQVVAKLLGKDAQFAMSYSEHFKSGTSDFSHCVIMHSDVCGTGFCWESAIADLKNKMNNKQFDGRPE